MELEQELAGALEQFPLPAKVRQISSLEVGNIHRTFRITLQSHAGNEEFLLQRLNKEVFFDIPLLMRNLQRISLHCKQWLQAKRFDYLKEVLEFVPAKSGQSYVRYADGNFYRLTKFIRNSVSYSRPLDDAQAFSAARSLADFERCLADLRPDEIQESIKGFHDFSGRLEQLQQVVQEDPLKRVGAAKLLVDFALSHRTYLLQISSAVMRNQATLRIVHGDLKFNNLLFDSNAAIPLCVVDLDTCMPGTLAYDFGDFVRSCLVETAEDEIAKGLKEIDLRRFSALAAGFLEPLADLLLESEVRLMAETPALLALTLGIRFLTDFLIGDKYFMIKDAQHNLRRAQAQFALFESLHSQNSKFLEILLKHFELCKLTR